MTSNNPNSLSSRQWYRLMEWLRKHEEKLVEFDNINQLIASAALTPTLGRLNEYHVREAARSLRIGLNF